MGHVDVDDDSIRRFVVRHYRYDPQRRERRHVVIGAFDNEAEFDALIEAVTADIRRRRMEGDRVGQNEHASGVVLEPGDRRRAAMGHQMRRMVEHGVDPRPWIDAEDVPRNIALLTPDGQTGPHFPPGSRGEV